jgi:hypothetical protein
MKWNFFKRNWKDNLEWSENDFQENEEPISKNKEPFACLSAFK